MSEVSEMQQRVDEVERLVKLRLVDGLLESTVLKERREWLASLDLTHYLLEVVRDQLRGLLAHPPEDSANGVKHWLRGIELGCLASLKETAFAHRSRRIYHLGLIDQWEATTKLLELVVDDVYVELSRSRSREARRKKEVQTDAVES